MSIFSEVLNSIFGPDDSADPADHATNVTKDIEEMLDQASVKENLDWRNSVVDLMKAIGVDTSVEARTELAKDLGYTGPDDSATRNIWLHEKLLSKLSKKA